MTSPVHLLPRGRSWGEDMQIYKTSKAVLPWRPEQQTPVRHITRYEKSREEREYDLIRAQYRDVKREAATKAKEMKDQMAALADAKVKQSQFVPKFNIINHSSSEAESVDNMPRPPNTRVGYNIVNHVNLDVPPVQVAPSSPLGKKMVNSRHLARPFSVISNKYHSNHDARFEEELTRAKETATTKFLETHDFNPLLVRYYDHEKENTFLLERQARQKIHGVDRDDKLPHGEQYCASRLYNLVNHTVLRPEKFEMVSNVGNRRLNVIKSTQINKEIHKRAEALDERTMLRALNRISHARNDQTYVHGYDPITNQPFDGRLRKARVPVRTQPKPKAWNRVERPTRAVEPLPAIESTPVSALRPIQPEILYISHDTPIDPGGASVAPAAMNNQRSSDH
ncbi:hypothetical protein Ae201684P_014238 [Aphanomyces euteiches]|uniref:Uncharacterized protein n=1 Tax=Aphanomyces euteiches TaxID=100861 RepID=A0A6G0WYN2_9STRA|nr:hypothetical protein Ae201684_010369 [Aphanomyces euteiches]KAH9090436.1 hypothetical protein Ae201684P_014238 [Aphanomyces euteiches]KAH9150411.1 hypothetical protein AeRB84_006731 [Aphanomyces euteiches]